MCVGSETMGSSLDSLVSFSGSFKETSGSTFESVKEINRDRIGRHDIELEV